MTVDRGDSPTQTSTARAPATLGLRIRVLNGPLAGQIREIGRSPLKIGSDAANDIVIADSLVSRKHLTVAAHPGGAEVIDLASRNGTLVNGIGVTHAIVPAGAVIRIGASELLLEPEPIGVELPPSDSERLGGLLGSTITMRRLFTALERVAPTDYTVLVEGETGTGKECVARAIHELSPRRANPIVVFDCASANESLLDSQLFGHVRGAFTGAVGARDGAFKRAHRGTLFIDELDSLPLSLQGKLLGGLERREVLAVGADEPTSVDVRVVAATSKSLTELVQAGRFREDLFYRLSVVKLDLPPLRERAADVLLLAQHFLRGAGNSSVVEGPNAARLTAHAWPGNVRELRNVMERALALSGSPLTPFSELPIQLGAQGGGFVWPASIDSAFKDAKEQLLSAFEREYVTRQLQATGGNLSEAARRAGLSRRHLHELVRKHGLVVRDDD